MSKNSTQPSALDGSMAGPMQVAGESREALGSRRGYVLFILCAVYSVSVFDRNILSILLEPVRAELNLSDTHLGFLSGLAFALFYVTLAVPIARLADLWKRTRVIALSLAVFSTMTALCSLAMSFWQLLLMRVGVGIGEAGTTPSSTAIIADLYPEESRGSAMSLFAIGGSSGVFLGFAVGGFVAETFGWRYAFLVAAFPGLALALLMHFTVKEPQRSASQQRRAVELGGKPSTVEVLRFLWMQRSLRHLTLGIGLLLLFGYAFQTWLPSYFQRSFGMGIAQTGFIMGVPFGVLGVLGMLAAGVLADRLVNDMRWRSWIVAIAVCTAFPFCVLTMLAPSKYLAIAAYAIPSALGTFYIAPVFALIQSLAPPHMRATALATVIAVANIVGMGLGAQIVGILSDLLNSRYGAESLRFALLACTPALVWAAMHFYRAAVHLETDLARAREA
jgi:MFS family permease